MKNLKNYCREIYQDDDGWWAILKPQYAWGTDDNGVMHEDTYQELLEAAQDIHRR